MGLAPSPFCLAACGTGSTGRERRALSLFGVKNLFSWSRFQCAWKGGVPGVGFISVSASLSCGARF